MKTLSLLMIIGAMGASVLSGCSSGPSPEQQTRELQEEKDVAKKQSTFFNTSPPPLEQPGH